MLTIQEIDGQTATTLVDSVRDSRVFVLDKRGNRIPYFPWFKEGFGGVEFPSPDRFVPDPTKTYYLVTNRGREEAILSASYNLSRNPPTASISLARLFPKDHQAAEGWEYLYQLLMHMAATTTIAVASVKPMSKGGGSAIEGFFEKFPDTRHPHNGNAVDLTRGSLGRNRGGAVGDFKK